jgi:hypothetical protein
MIEHDRKFGTEEVLKEKSHQIKMNGVWTGGVMNEQIEKIITKLGYISDGAHTIKITPTEHDCLLTYISGLEKQVAELEDKHLFKTVGALQEHDKVIVHNKALEEAAKVGVKLKLGGCSIYNGAISDFIAAIRALKQEDKS